MNTTAPLPPRRVPVDMDNLAAEMGRRPADEPTEWRKTPEKKFTKLTLEQQIAVLVVQLPLRQALDMSVAILGAPPVVPPEPEYSMETFKHALDLNKWAIAICEAVPVPQE